MADAARARPGEVVMTERIRATPEQVWEYLVHPEKLTRWMGRRARIDVTPGGEFRLDITGDDVAAGSYVEVERPYRLVLTWGWEGSAEVPPGSSTVSFTLTADGEDTLVELVHRGLPVGQDDRHAEGWTYYLDRFARASAGEVLEPQDMRNEGDRT